MFEALLGLCLVAALCKKASRPFAYVLFSVWVIDLALAVAGQHKFIPWADSLAIYPLVWLANNNRKWWGVACCSCAILAPPLHVWFWWNWSMGIWVYQPYSAVQNGLFLLSVAVLVFGNYDLADLARGVLERIRSLYGFGRTSAHAFRGRSVAALKKEAALDE